MNRFIEGSDQHWESLRQSANLHCIKYLDVTLPGCIAEERSDIGFEIDPANGKATLFINLGLHADATAPLDIKELVDNGFLEFDSWDLLKAYFQNAGNLMRRSDALDDIGWAEVEVLSSESAPRETVIVHGQSDSS